MPSNISMPDANFFNQLVSNDTSFFSDWAWSAEENCLSDILLNSGNIWPLPSMKAGTDMLQQEHCVIEGANAQDLSARHRSVPAEEICFNDLSKHCGEIKKVVEVIEIPHDTESSPIGPTPPNNSQGLKRKFGPSRQISLPPARTGGTKGPRSTGGKRERE